MFRYLIMVNKRFNIFIVGCSLLFSSVVAADYIKPSDNVLALIVAIQKNDFRGIVNNADLVAIASHARHSYSPNQLIELFEGIDIDKINVVDIVGSDFVIKVRVSGSINLDFELESIQHKSKPNRTYRVIGIHP